VWHYHAEIELTLVTKGSGAVHCGNSILPLREGYIYCFGPNLPHAFISQPRSPHAAWSVLHFRLGDFGEPFWDKAQTSPIAKMLERCRNGLVFPAAPKTPLETSFLTIPRTGRLSAFLALLEELALSTYGRTISRLPLPDPQLNSHTLLHRAIRHAEDALSGPVSQSKVSAELRMSPQAFSRFFKNLTGRTFQRYCNELRIAQVCSSLETGTATISEAAFAAGFNNLANFNRRFRDVTGQSPSDYLASIREPVANTASSPDC
jgi:AraC-like DNA-binding protein